MVTVNKLSLVPDIFTKHVVSVTLLKYAVTNKKRPLGVINFSAISLGFAPTKDRSITAGFGLYLHQEQETPQQNCPPFFQQ